MTLILKHVPFKIPRVMCALNIDHSSYDTPLHSAGAERFYDISKSSGLPFVSYNVVSLRVVYYRRQRDVSTPSGTSDVIGNCKVTKWSEHVDTVVYTDSDKDVKAASRLDAVTT